jgi:hypothetical protein
MTSRTAETFRAFWHGSPLGPYHLVGLRSFVDHGHRVELFTYDDNIAVPEWIARRDANEVWPTEHIMHYRTEPGRGSPALHANLFRYVMLHQLGGWWIDLDVVLRADRLPPNEIFFAVENSPRYGIGVLKFPKGHALLGEAIEHCLAVDEADAVFAETGPLLFSNLVVKYGLTPLAQPAMSTHPILGSDVLALFDPARRDELERRSSTSYFIHLYNELWRRSGIPRCLAPPRGSFLDALIARYDPGAAFAARMDVADVARWTAYLHLHEEYQGGLNAYRSSYQNLKERMCALEQQLQAAERDRDAALASRDEVLANAWWRLTKPLREMSRRLETRPRQASDRIPGKYIA